MASKRERDYQAEYRRRIERARAKGLTTAQGRRGAKKYAATKPQEHRQRAATTRAKYGATPREVTRKKLAQRVVKGVGEARRNLATFHKLNNALNYAAGLPPRSEVFIMGHGTIRNQNKYQGRKKGWLTLTQLSRPHLFTNPIFRDDVKKRDEELFDPRATTYEVRWI